MLFISHSISISETNPSTFSLHIVRYFKLGVECHDGEKIGVQEKSKEKDEEEKREGFNDMKRMKRKRATQQGKSSNIIGAVEMAWEYEEKVPTLYNQFTVFLFFYEIEEAAAAAVEQKMRNDYIESATGNRNSWKQKKKLSLSV